MAGKFLIVGFLLLLGSGIALLKFVHGDSSTRDARASKAGSETDESAPGVASSAGDTPAKPGTVAVAGDSKPSMRTSAPSIAGSVPAPSGDDEIKYRPDGVPIAVADLDVLRAASPPTDPLVRECIAKHGGKAVTGTLITTYTVARKREKDGSFSVHTESTGYEEEGSTITDPELIDCLVKTANEMKWPKSNSPVATWARRRIVVENGVMGENWVLKHGYIR